MNKPAKISQLTKEERLQAIIQYHQRTKHRFEAYARGPDTLDWDDQPSPFRQFSDTSKIALPFEIQSPIADFFETFQLFSNFKKTIIGSNKPNDGLSPVPFSLASISDFFRLFLC